MMVLVIGGSGSGKSAYAEELVARDSAMRKYYIATMRVLDKEGERKVERHKQLRSGKGFITIEQPVDIEKAIQGVTGTASALLECMSNLVANEMFSGEKPKTEEEVSGKILTGIKVLREELAHLVIVGNNVFEDGIVYDETTMAYIRAMGKIHCGLAAVADKVVEVTAGIPVVIKQ